MRPVNLIPVEERRGASRAPAGTTGNGIYALLGVLGVLLLGALLVVLQGNKINNQKSELAKLKAENEEAVQHAEQSGSALPDAAFEAAAQARFDVIHKTAAERFNFQRRIRQLTRAIPDTVKLTTLSASLKGEDSGASDAGASGGADPTFKMAFCIVKEDRWQQLAETMTRMRNLDGVRKVTVDASTKPEKSADGGGGGGGGGGGDANSPCPSEEFTSGIIVHFRGMAAAADSSAAAAGAGPKNAVQQAQGAGATSDAANSAAGADSSSSSSSSSSGSTPAPGGSP